MTPHDELGAPDASVVDLLADLAGATVSLVREELALARVEVVRNASRLRDEVAVLACGAMVTLLGGQALVGGGVELLSRWVEPWLANLIVGGVLILIGGPLVVLMWRRLDLRALVPRRALASLRQNRDWVRGRPDERL